MLSGHVQGYVNSAVKGYYRSVQLLRSYSNGIRSEGLQPQLVHCAPFLSIAQYLRKLYILCPKIRMAIVAYLKVWMTIIWYLKVRISIIYLSEGKDKYCIPIQRHVWISDGSI
jgi:hypothetical protein